MVASLGIVYIGGVAVGANGAVAAASGTFDGGGGSYVVVGNP
jgi:hypothetical protein